MKVLKRLERLIQFSFKSKNEKTIYALLKNSLSSTGTVDKDLIYIGNILKIAYEKFPNKIALISSSRELTYKEFYFRSILMSNKLKSLGVKKGDKVLLYFENSIEFYVAYFAIWQIGATIIPVNVFLHEKELAHVLNDSQPALAFVMSGFLGVWNKLKDLNLVENLPIILSEKDFDFQTQVPTDKTIFKNFEIEQLSKDELCLLLYTSGTTGKPKGVMLSSKNLLSNALQAYTRLISFDGKKNKDKYFCVLPLFHVFAQNTCIWLPIIAGSAVIIVQKIDRKLILEALEKKPTVFFGFPALFGLLCLLKTAPLQSVRIFVCGADMLPDKIRSAFAMIYGRKICAGYGLTEASPVVAINLSNDARLASNVAGQPLFGIECQIRDENEQVLPLGGIGNLWVKGDNVMMGYYKDPVSTEKVLKDGWLNTGDLGFLHPDGNLSVSGRTKDLIIHKGFNIYPQEIENVLMSHPAVIKAAVIGKDEPLSGQIPVAFVAVNYKNDDLEKNLRELCLNNLASYKIPKHFICLDDLPMNSTGKVDKKQLKV